LYRSRVQSFIDWVLKKFDICDKVEKQNIIKNQGKGAEKDK
jgi:hypothetical protein